MLSIKNKLDGTNVIKNGGIIGKDIKGLGKYADNKAVMKCR